ncbi:MAG: hypothetical protein NT027_17365 [Proteobacteria bacterium]|nr:hypothetical protein [Pseudomonadota bacterium]
MLKLSIWLTIFCVIACTKVEWAMACATGAPRSINLYASYETGTVGATTPVNQMDIHSCSPSDSGKYLMVTMGPDLIGLDYSRQISFTDDFRDDECTLKDAPLLKLRSYSQELIDYREQRSLLEHCVIMEFKDLSTSGLSLPDQPIVNGKPLCSLRMIDSSTAIGWGGACFIGLHQDTNLTIQYRTNPECAQSSYLSKQSIKPQDVHGAFSIYLTDSPSGLSTDLEALHSGNFRMTIAPSSKLLPVSTDFGNTLPRWPVQYAPDVHLGELTIYDQGSASGVLTSWLADNSCQEICKDGVCSSPCNYLTPIASEVALHETSLNSSGKPQSQFLSGWYQGGAIPAKWQGMVRDTLHRIEYNPFKIGSTYRLSAKFSYPDTYFRMSSENLRRKLITSINLKNSVIGRDPLNPLMPLQELRTLLPQVPTLETLPNFELPNLGSRVFNVQKSLDTLTSFLSLENWPPYFESLCNRDLQSCKSPYTERASIEIDLDFKIEALNADRTYQLSNMIIHKRTSFGENYDRPIENLPSIECRQQ